MSYGQSTNTNEFSAAYPGSSNTNGFVSTGNSSDHSNIGGHYGDCQRGPSTKDTLPDSSDTTSRLDSSSASTTENWKPTALAGGRSARQTEESSDASKPGIGDKLRGMVFARG